MIKKTRKITLAMQAYEALLRRVSKNHPARPLIEKKYSTKMKGFRGEKAINYYLKQIPENQFLILHDLRLVNNDQYFQMDTLILSATFILIVEVKNFDGHLFFDHKHMQLIRTLDGKKEGYRYPLTQLTYQKRQLTDWLAKKKLTNIPIETLVVISFPSTIYEVSTDDPKVVNRIMHSEILPQKINQFTSFYKRELLSKADLRKLSKQLIEAHTPELPNVLEQFNINQSEIISGVYCDNYSSLPMVRKRKRWICENCNHSSRDGHIQLLKDYALLINPTITNKQFREFAHLPSRSSATYILKSMKLKCAGKTKGSKYFLPLEEAEENSKSPPEIKKTKFHA